MFETSLAQSLVEGVENRVICTDRKLRRMRMKRSSYEDIFGEKFEPYISRSPSTCR
jgi:hypothetical protein